MFTKYNKGSVAVRLAIAKKKSIEAGVREYEKNLRYKIVTKFKTTNKKKNQYLKLLQTRWFQKKKKLVEWNIYVENVNRKATDNIHFKKILYFNFLNGFVFFKISVGIGFVR